jgi:hypothetical protein
MLWFPWSYNANLGSILMLTLGVALWAFVAFLALKTYPRQELIAGAMTIALIFLLASVIMDYIFFGLIRNAMQDLYHPTTLCGYGFLLVWPLIMALIFKKNVYKYKKTVTNSEKMMAGISGLISFGALTVIIALETNV